MFANKFLTEELEIVNQLDYASAATDRTPAAGVPTAGCEGIVFFVKYAAIAGTANAIKAIGSASSNLGTPSDLAGTGQAIATDFDNGIAMIDLKGPFQHAYVGVYIDKDTTNTTAEVAFAARYGLRKTPSTQPTGVQVERHAAPVAGTA